MAGHTYIVGGPESFELEVPLQSVAQAALELCGQRGHALETRVVHQRTHRLQVLNTTKRKATLTAEQHYMEKNR